MLIAQPNIPHEPGLNVRVPGDKDISPMSWFQPGPFGKVCHAGRRGRGAVISRCQALPLTESRDPGSRYV